METTKTKNPFDVAEESVGMLLAPLHVMAYGFAAAKMLGMPLKETIVLAAEWFHNHIKLLCLEKSFEAAEAAGYTVDEIVAAAMQSSLQADEIENARKYLMDPGRVKPKFTFPTIHLVLRKMRQT